MGTNPTHPTGESEKRTAHELARNRPCAATTRQPGFLHGAYCQQGVTARFGGRPDQTPAARGFRSRQHDDEFALPCRLVGIRAVLRDFGLSSASGPSENSAGQNGRTQLGR